LPFASHIEALEPRVMFAAIDAGYGFNYGPDTSGILGAGAGADGSVYVFTQAGGYGDYGVVKFNPNGKLDPTFGGDGFAEIPGGSRIIWGYFDVDSQGRSYVMPMVQTPTDSTKHDAILYRLTPQGTFDTTFDGDGAMQVLTSPGRIMGMTRTVQVTDDGKILVAADVDSYNADGTFGARASLFERYNSDGTRDLSFGVAGQVMLTNRPVAQLQDIAVDRQGRIVFTSADAIEDPTTLSGWRGIGLMGRLNADGSVDATFATDGMGTATGSRIATDTLGRIYVYGGNGLMNPEPGDDKPRIGILRLLENGQRDTTWGVAGYAALIDLPGIYSAVDQFVATPEGGILGVSGDASTWTGEDYAGNLIALDASGQLDARVAPNGHLRFLPPGANQGGAYKLVQTDADTAYVIGSTYGGRMYVTKFDLFAGEVPAPLPEPIIEVPVNETDAENPTEAGGGFRMDVEETETPAPLQRLGFFSDDDDLLDRVNQDVLV
jgi:uncharacterized delta-60 repeat protein